MESLQCLNCIHYQGGSSDGVHCAAFPMEGEVPIPQDIFTGRFDHRKPHEGDHGIRYESSGLIPEVDEEY